MTYENYIKARLADFAVNEAYSYGGTACMAAVAQVIANRVNAGWGEWKTVLDTARDYCGTVPDPPKFEARELTFRRMLAMVDDIYQNTADDSAVNFSDDRGPMRSLYYADLSNLNRPWFRENVLAYPPKHPRLASVGPLTFFA
jgi:hypothetical protein